MVAPALRIEHRRADGILDHGILGEQVEPGLAVEGFDGGHGGLSELAGGRHARTLAITSSANRRSASSLVCSASVSGPVE